MERIISGDHGMDSSHSHYSAWEPALQGTAQARSRAMEISDLTQTHSQVLKITQSSQHQAKHSSHGDLHVIHHNIKGYRLTAQSEGIAALHLSQSSIKVLRLASIYSADLLQHLVV